MSEKWQSSSRSRTSPQVSSGDSHEVKAPIHSQRHRSTDNTSSSSSHRRHSPYNEKRKHKHHHKRSKKDKRRSRSPNQSRKRSKSRSRSRSRDGNGNRESSYRRQGRPGNERQVSDFKCSSRRSMDLNYRSRSTSRDRGKSKEMCAIDTGKNNKEDSNPTSTTQQHFIPSAKGLPVEAAKLKEEIERRKLLWSKKEKPAEAPVPLVWKQTAFSDDNDGKVSAKFKRLMGMKDGEHISDGLKSSATVPEKPGSDKQRQDEYFANLEKQYEVARATTHTQRGLGLGFSSSRLLPR